MVLRLNFQSMDGGIPLTAHVILQTPAGCLTIQPNSDTVYQEVASDSTGWRLSPTSLLPVPPLSDARCKLSLSLVLRPTSYSSEVPPHSAQVQLIQLVWERLT